MPSGQMAWGVRKLRRSRWKPEKGCLYKVSGLWTLYSNVCMRDYDLATVVESCPKGNGVA